jgi:hypothetical protein
MKQRVVLGIDVLVLIEIKPPHTLGRLTVRAPSRDSGVAKLKDGEVPQIEVAVSVLVPH